MDRFLRGTRQFVKCHFFSENPHHPREKVVAAGIGQCRLCVMRGGTLLVLHSNSMDKAAELGLQKREIRRRKRRTENRRIGNYRNVEFSCSLLN